MSSPLVLSLALSYHVASRLAYVIGIGVALTRQDRYQVFTRRDGVELGFRRFRRMAAFLMNNDALSFVVLCLATRDTFPSPLPVPVAIAGGALLIAAGLGVKLWAASALGPAAYYWGNFFRDEPAVAPSLTGPYRWLDNPMYTVGYLHAYGFALATQSVPGLFAAVFDQAAILAFHYLVERPHFALLMKQAPGQSR